MLLWCQCRRRESNPSVRSGGIEPPAFSLGERCSVQLSYGRSSCYCMTFLVMVGA